MLSSVLRSDTAVRVNIEIMRAFVRLRRAGIVSSQVMALVEDREREAAASATTLARTLAQAISPAATGWLMQAVALSAPFAIGGALKIVYDLTLWASFRKVPLRGDRIG